MRRTYLSLAGGIALAFLAVILIRIYLGGAAREPEMPLTAIVVASHDLDNGAKLEANDIQLVRWPASSVPRGAFDSFDAIFSGAKSPGDRLVLVAMVPGEPVLRTKISGFGARPTLSARVGPGMRAFSIKIDDVSGVAGFILPGDRVDIMLTRTVGSGSLVADVIMQSVTVLGIDQLSDQRADKPVVGRTATVEVTPQQAEKLALAQKAGTLSLSLRNQQTTDVVATAPVAEHDLIGGVTHKVRAAAAPPSVRVRYGGSDVVNKTIGQ